MTVCEKQTIPTCLVESFNDCRFVRFSGPTVSACHRRNRNANQDGETTRERALYRESDPEGIDFGPITRRVPPAKTLSHAQ